MSNKFFFSLLVVTAGILVGWYVLGSNSSFDGKSLKTEDIEKTVSPTSRMGKNNLDQSVAPDQSGERLEKGGAEGRMVVTYTDTGFAPTPLIVKKGTTVTYVNESSRGMWVASAVHPTHQLLPGFDQLSAVPKAGMYEYTFTKVGTWVYHNHVSPRDTGSVVVSE